jgi:sulfur carrier protein
MTAHPKTAIKVNGVDEEVAATTIGELLAARGIDPGAKFLAVAVNGAVVRRASWAEAVLNPGDAVEIVRPLQGG